MNDAPIPDWIEWEGGEKCPVPAGTLVEVKFRHGNHTSLTSCPEQWRWTDSSTAKRGSEYDIVAYHSIRKGSS